MDMEQLPTQTATAEPGEQKTFSAVLIDDSEEDRFALRRLLRRSASDTTFDIREADTGARGIALCREYAPDCLLLDYDLGDTDAVALLAELNAGRDVDDPVCPSVVLTGAGTVAQSAVRALKAGAQDYLVKETLTPEGIALAIESAIEKVRLRREVRQTEARLRSSLDHMIEGFGIYTALRDASNKAIYDFRCDYVNDAACQAFHLTREEQIGRQLISDLFPEQRASGLFEKYIRLVELGEPVNETSVWFAVGLDKGEPSERIFDIRAWKMDDGFAATWRDVTSQRRAEAELQEAETRLAFAVAASDAGVFEIDFVTGQRLYAARTFDLLGIPRPAIFRQPLTAENADKVVFAPVTAQEVWERIYPEDRPRIQEALEQVCDPQSDTKGILEAEYRVLLPSGEERWIATNGRVTFDSSGQQPMRLAGLVRDVTLRKREQQAVQELAAMKGHLAEAVQQSLLLAPAPDAYPGVTTSTFYRSAWDDAFIGGDFFDIFAVSEEVIALVVGDATGKGVAAATYTAEVKFALRAFLREHNGSLPIALKLLNRFIYDNARLDAAHTGSGYIALAAALVNTKSGEVSFSCAGAEPPLILHKETGVVEEIPIFGPLLGALDDGEYTEIRKTITKGDIIALTSDGITEVRRPIATSADGRVRRGEFFGVEGLAKALHDGINTSPEQSLADLPAAIVFQAMEWAGGHQHDDICLLIAQRN